MYWFIYSINAAKKRAQMKMLYENMLTTYVSMADDIFGKNQKNNPSIQDFMFEIVDTNKYQVKELDDVPMAKTYYSKKKSKKKIVTNIKYINKDIEEEKEAIIYNETKNYYYQNKYRNNLKLSEKIYNIEEKKENSSNKINLSFNYNDNSIFDESNKKNNYNEKNKYNNYNTSWKRFRFKNYQINDNSTNNNKNDNDSSINKTPTNSNTYNTSSNFYQKYKAGNSDYKSYNNIDKKETNISFNINNNIYSNTINNDKNTELYKGSYGRNISYYNYKNNTDKKDIKELNYSKYNTITKNNTSNNSNYYNKEMINRNNDETYGCYSCVISYYFLSWRKTNIH